MKNYQDIRYFISTLEQEGEILRVKDEINWKYGIGDRTRETQVSGVNGKALLFENIKDYPGHKIFTNGLGSYSRIAMALGLNRQTSLEEIARVFAQRISNLVEPVLVEDATFRENIHTSTEVDLEKLPVPWWNQQDGGRYIGTWHLNITKDPDTGIRNVGIYRMQLIGPRTTAVSVSPRSHLAMHIERAERKGISLEMAVAIAVDETLIMAGAAAPPFGTDEFYLAGGLRKEPVELVPCRTIRLDVPASSEIVLEGTIDPNRRVSEGPFLDYAGIPKKDPHAYLYEVSSLMFRNNPIFRGTAVGLPGAEDHLLLSLLSRAGCLDFHGNRIRQKIQNKLIARGLFKTFQFTGRLRQKLVQS